MHPAFGHGYTQVLRGLVVADIVIGVANILVGFWIDPLILPEDLKKYVVDSRRTSACGCSSAGAGRCSPPSRS
jgi:hypothetical protein